MAFDFKFSLTPPSSLFFSLPTTLPLSPLPSSLSLSFLPFLSQSELDVLKVNHDHSEHQRQLVEKNSEEQRAELAKLRLAVSELELLKESLLFQTSSHEGTISSLKSQVR